jgi:hypothetical protein
MIDGIRCETIKQRTRPPDAQPYYIGRIAIYEQGKRLYVITGPIMRLSRGDAMKDASIMAHDLRVQNFLTT